MSITWRSLIPAIWAQVQPALTAAGVPATLEREDIERPVKRRSVKIDVTDTADDGGDDQAERSFDVELYLYPQDETRPRNECMDASAAIVDALRAGIAVGGFPIRTTGGITSEIMAGVLVIRFSLDWLETAEEDGEPMDELALTLE